MQIRRENKIAKQIAGYEDVKTSGLLKNVLGINEVLRETESSLVSPEKLFISRVEIRQESGGEHHTDIFGVILQTYIGKPVELVESFYRLNSGRRLLVQEFYVEGKRVINQAVVKQI
jgi:hypothetical protein